MKKATARRHGAHKAVSRDFVVISNPGLYLLPACVLARTASRFTSVIRVTNDDLTVDAKSAMEVMSLCAVKGTILKVTAKGLDATEALDAMETLFIAPFKAERDRMLAPRAAPSLEKLLQLSPGRRPHGPVERAESMLIHV